SDRAFPCGATCASERRYSGPRTVGRLPWMPTAPLRVRRKYFMLTPSPSRRRQRRTVSRVLVTTVAVLLLLAAGVWLGGHPGWMPSALPSAFVNDSGSRPEH